MGSSTLRRTVAITSLPALLLIVAPAGADLIPIPLAPQDTRKVLRDTESGLEWIRLDHTWDLSYDQAAAAYGAPQYGLRHATADELCEFFANNAVALPICPDPPLTNHFFEDLPDWETYIDLMHVLIGLDPPPSGFYLQYSYWWMAFSGRYDDGGAVDRVGLATLWAEYFEESPQYVRVSIRDDNMSSSTTGSALIIIPGFEEKWGNFMLRPWALCRDGIDNDGDGATDYVEDPGCNGPTDQTEYGGAAAPPAVPGLSFVGSGIAAALLALSSAHRLSRRRRS